MNKEQLTSINRTVMKMWLVLGVIGLGISGYLFFFEDSEGISTYLVLSLIAFMMYGWKRFQINKFS